MSEINQLDAEGRKTGYWNTRFPSVRLVLTSLNFNETLLKSKFRVNSGHYEDDHRVGYWETYLETYDMEKEKIIEQTFYGKNYE